MCDSFHMWQNVLVQWINCLALQDNPVRQVKELSDGRFFCKLLNVISHKTKHSISTGESNEEVTSFLKYEYPNYCMDAKSCEVEDDVEITYITSLLLLHSVLKSENKRIMDHMYNLDHGTQIYIKNFFEIILQYDGNITRSALKHAINEYGNTSPKATGKGLHCSESPLTGFSTPKCPPIKDVIESPLAQKLKQLSEQRSVIKRLNNELEVEQMEKVELQEELRQQHEKTKKLVKELTDKTEEIKKLHEECLHSNSESHEKHGSAETCQEALLRNEIKSLEAYITCVHADMDTLHKEQDLLQQRLFVAEHQYHVWHTKSQEYEAQCEKLQRDLVEKELELAQVKELCSDLQNHVQELKQVGDVSVEEDNCANPVFRTPENLGQAVVDLKLHEKEEENEALSEQLKRMIVKEEEMTRHISDLELRLEDANNEAGSLKISNIELANKMETLQHELEESERKLNSASAELDHVSQERILLEKGFAELQDLLTCKNSELLDSHNVAESLASDLAQLQDKFLETQKILDAEVEHVAKLDLEVHETEKQLKCTSQELADIKIENTEVKQNLGCIEQQLGQNVKLVERMLLLGENPPQDAEQSPTDRTEGSLAVLYLSVGAKVERLNFLLIDLYAKNLKSLHERSDLESSHKKLNESIMKLRGEIADWEERDQKHLQQKSMLEECLQRADENISSLQIKVSEYSHKIENLNSVLEGERTEIKHLQEVRQNLSDRNEKLEKLNEDETAKLQRFETELTEVSQDKILLQDQYNKMKEFSEEQTKTENMLNCKIAELEKQIQELVKERDCSHSNLQNINSKLQELQASKENLEQTYNKAMQENEESIQRLNGHVSVFEDRINELEKRVALADEQLDCLKENIAEMNKNKDILKLQYDTENQKKAEQIELLNQHMRKLETTVAELEEEKKGIVCKLKSAEEERCLQLKLESQKTSEIKQAYETLLEVNYKLQSENEDLKSKMEEKTKAIRQEYEKKLDRLKAQMRIICDREIGKNIKKSKQENEHLQAMCTIYKDKIQSYENDVGILKSQMWQIGDKLLMAEREKKKLEEELSKQKTFLQSVGNKDDFLESHATLSNLGGGRKVSSTEVHTMDIIDESITLVRRKTSVPRTLPSGIGAMFNPEDEEGEVFNTTNLADLKMGRCVPQGYKGRISELQYRNSLCPPHLKSSYPAETQFHDPREYRDEDLKLGCAVDVDQFDALSTSMLLPSEKQRKKDRGQTSYKKPGPPTPGKNGGRLFFQGTEVLTPRAPLRESNDGACVRKASTPSRLKSLFTNKNRRDENTPVTPRGRRLSNIFRRQVKNHH